MLIGVGNENNAKIVGSWLICVGNENNAKIVGSWLICVRGT
jgi:hypothetical protein